MTTATHPLPSAPAPAVDQASTTASTTASTEPDDGRRRLGWSLVAPHRVRVDRGLIKVGSYLREDNHQVWLRMSTRTVMRLSVTGPECSSRPRTAAVSRH